MKSYFVALIIAAIVTISAAAVMRQKAGAQDASLQLVQTRTPIDDAAAAKTNTQDSSPIFVTEIPPGYRDWRLISVAHEEGNLNDIRAILGNDIAIKAYREATLPFPEGTIIARIAWDYVSSEENNKTFGHPQSFVAGAPKNGVQFMVKDSKKYAATGGWGFAHFNENDKKPADGAFMQSCFACHQAVHSRDLVFTRYAP